MSTIAEAEEAVKFNVFYAKKMLWMHLERGDH